MRGRGRRDRTLGPAVARRRPRCRTGAADQPRAGKGRPLGAEDRMPAVGSLSEGRRHELHQAARSRPCAVRCPCAQRRLATRDGKLKVKRNAPVHRGAANTRHWSCVGALVHRNALDTVTTVAALVGFGGGDDKERRAERGCKHRTNATRPPLRDVGHAVSDLAPAPRAQARLTTQSPRRC